jgi:N-hydroxyarylamine O-acetyltransferase
MPNDAFDQKAWLARIGYDGPVTPTLDGLHRLIAAHAYAVAYESLDIMLGRTPRLDLASLQNKMIRHYRGGYCLEQNMLFRAGLRLIGFEVTSFQGRFVRGLAIDAPRAGIHMVLQVNLPEGPYIADVGFGNLAPTCALRLELGLEQETPHERMRFVDVGGEPTLQARVGDTWEHIYRVIPYPRYDMEYEITNWYTATHPDAPYATNIIAARPRPDRTRLTMFNERVNLRHADGGVERSVMTNRDEYASVLRDGFGLNLSDDELNTILAVRARHGVPGSSHPFFG